MTNAALKYKKIISKSNAVQRGSPTLYQLRPKKENIGTLKRRTLGVKNPDKLNKTILLVGETGAGKSSLINALVNFAMGVKWEDDVWFQIVEEEKKEQTQSQTSDVIVYEIFGHEDKTLPYSLTVIDTPGHGSTGGIEHDGRVSQRLFDLFRSVGGVHEINAVGLVLKAGENRLNDRLSYVFNSVVSLFGKDLEQNIVALVTHSPGRTPKNALDALDAANIKCARNDKNQPVHFLFDNCQHEARTEDVEDLEQAYNKAMKGMKQFTDFLQKTAPRQLEITVHVLNERIRLTACIQNLQERIQSMELKQKEIQQTQEALKKYEEGLKSLKEFTIEVDESYKFKEPIESGRWGLFFYEGAVTCNICEENCHFPGCTMALSPSHCKVMKEGHCTSCTNSNKEVKKKYEENKAQNEKNMGILESLQKEMENLEAHKIESLYEAYNHVVKLEQIALSVVSVSTYVHLDFLIEEMEKKGDSEKVQKLKEMSSRKDNALIARIKSLYRTYLSSK